VLKYANENLNAQAVLYAVTVNDSFIKVGITILKPEFTPIKAFQKRYKNIIYKQLQIGNPHLVVSDINTIIKLEEEVKDPNGSWAVYRVMPKEMPDGHTECFSLMAALDIHEYIDDYFDPGAWV
jgi:hypothetical protein